MKFKNYISGIKNTLYVKKMQITAVLLLCFVTAMQVFDKFFLLKGREYAYWNSDKIANIFLFVAIVAIIALLIVSKYIINKNIAIHKLCLFCVLLLGMVYTIIFLPFTVPDEGTHFFTSYRISNYLLFDFDQWGNSNVIMRQSDVSFKVSSELSSNYYRTIKQQVALFSNDNTLVESSASANAASNAPFGYIVSAFAIAISRLLRLSPLLTFYMGRIANLVLYAFLTYLAIKKIPYGKMAIFAISILPMTLHLVGSYSYDFLAIAMAMLYVAQVLYMKEKDGYITVKDIVLCALWGIILAPTKIVYSPILLLVLIIPKEKFKNSSKFARLSKLIIVASGILVLLLIQGSRVLGSATSEVGGPEGGEIYSLSWILENPLDTVKIFVKSLLESTGHYINCMVGSSLAWFQINVSSLYYLPFYFVLGYCFLKRDTDTVKFSYSNRMLALFIIFVSVILVFASMFVAWTGVGSTTIAGVQGRYFLPILILLLMITLNKFAEVKQSSDKYIVIFVLFWHLVTVIEYFAASFV